MRFNRESVSRLRVRVCPTVAVSLLSPADLANEVANIYEIEAYNCTDLSDEQIKDLTVSYFLTQVWIENPSQFKIEIDIMGADEIDTSSIYVGSCRFQPNMSASHRVLPKAVTLPTAP